MHELQLTLYNLVDVNLFIPYLTISHIVNQMFGTPVCSFSCWYKQLYVDIIILAFAMACQLAVAIGMSKTAHNYYYNLRCYF